MSTNTDNKVDFPKCKGIRISDSGKALLCSGLKEGSDTWVPLSQIHDDSEIFESGHEGTLIVSQWWAETAGLV